MQTSIPYEIVANMALDSFIDTAAPARATAASATADGGNAGSSDEEAGQPKRTALELHLPPGKN